jgi:hypothetical protein
VLYAGYVPLFKEDVTRSLVRVATKQRERCMKWFTASNQTLQAAFPLICETVYRRQPNKIIKLVFASHGATQAPSACAQGVQTKAGGYQSRTNREVQHCSSLGRPDKYARSPWRVWTRSLCSQLATRSTDVCTLDRSAPRCRLASCVHATGVSKRPRRTRCV